MCFLLSPIPGNTTALAGLCIVRRLSQLSPADSRQSRRYGRRKRRFTNQTLEKLQTRTSEFLQQSQEVGGHVQHEDRVQEEDRSAGEKLFRVKRHLQEI